MTDPARAIALKHLIEAKRSAIDVSRRKITEESQKVAEMSMEITAHENEMQGLISGSCG